MATQAGPLMKRVKIQGKDILLPADAVLEKSYPADGTEEEKQAWLNMQKDCPPYSIDRD